MALGVVKVSRLPCNTSRAELGGAPSTVPRDPRTWWPLAAVWPGGGEAASRRPLQLRAPGRQGDSLHLGAAPLRRRLEAPARPLLEQTKFHLRWPRKAHTTLIKFPL